MFTVTAFAFGAEIGYGEGDTYEWAMNEAAEAAEAAGPMYPAAYVTLVANKAGSCLTVEIPLTLWREAHPV